MTSATQNEYDLVLGAFQGVDELHTGTISLAKLGAVMQKLNPAIRDSEVTELAKNSGACMVNYAAFLKYLFHGKVDEQPELPPKPSVEPPLPGEPSSLEVAASGAEVAQVYQSRTGTVLRKYSMLKCDHFPSSSQIQSNCTGVPNFRKVEGLPVFGSGQPTIPGCSEVLDEVRKVDNPEKILWVNCREEPVVYINGRPYCVKDRSEPFGNLETTGITAQELVEKEMLLKKELYAEANLYGGKVLLHGEAKPTPEEIEQAKAKGYPAMGGVYAYWEPLVEVLCVHELYGQLQQQYPELIFMRLPITDEQEPEEKDFEQLAGSLKGAKPTWSVICNCQMGRGRTTTAMVLTTLLWSNIDSKVQRDVSTPSDLVIELASELATRLSNGEAASNWADNCMKKCSHMQDLKAVSHKKLGALSKSSKPKEVRSASHYLTRYLIVVCFAAYLLETNDAAEGVTFRSWMRSKQKESPVYEILEKAHKHDLK
eukprot:gnl/MRDRNA2_/MRDRNA2_107484_c0_seq1.p1 gnl/MRDRNA2_/MRDRNA2_107484_c0~~gnl/MRDRNA2_/MRDRNA2_107484_c0_seq1.p1  ORF type:complete len:483 (-),score=91.36 gnl/MRDRNA2_/MRDRNA2_107484_c0_seq1:114-1562(-)